MFEWPIKIKIVRKNKPTFHHIDTRTNKAKAINQNLAFTFAALFTACAIAIFSLSDNEVFTRTLIEYFNIDTSIFNTRSANFHLYITGVGVFPLFYILFNRLFMDIDFKYSKIRDNFIEWSNYIIIISLIIFIGHHKPEYVVMLLCYSINLRFLSYLLIFIFFIIIFSLILGYEKLKTNRKIINAACGIVFTVCLFILSRCYVTENYYNGSSSQGHYFSEYFFSIYRSITGQTQLVDFENINGLYANFIVPFLRLMGGASMHNVSVIMSVLVFISIGAVSIVIFRMCENKVLALLGSTAVAFITSIFTSAGVTGEFLLKYRPHKGLFAMLIILAAYLVTINRGKKYEWAYVLSGYILSSFSLLWNTDSGIIVLVAYSVFRAYLLITDFSHREKKFWFGIIRYTAEGLIAVGLSIYIMVVYTFIKSGEILVSDYINELIIKQLAFSNFGYMALKMTLIHPWLLLILIYALSFSKALRNLKVLRLTEEATHVLRLSMYILLSTLGMGYFSYYQGISNSSSFVMVSWPAVILLILYADDYLKRIKSGSIKSALKNDAVKVLKLASVVLFLSAIAVRFIGSATFLNEFDNFKVGDQPVESSRIYRIARKIESEYGDNEKIVLITEDATVLYMLMDEPVPNGQPDTTMMLTKASYNNVFEYLNQTKSKLVFDDDCFYLLQFHDAERFTDIMEHYSLSDQFEGYYVYSPAQVK